jgi:hypothetical protein
VIGLAHNAGSRDFAKQSKRFLQGNPPHFGLFDALAHDPQFIVGHIETIWRFVFGFPRRFIP